MSVWQGQSVLVLGTGASGLAMARWLDRNGARVRVADSRTQPPGAAALRLALPNCDMVLGPFDEALLAGVDLLALSPGLDVRLPLLELARAHGIAIEGETGLFVQALQTQERLASSALLAITGTNGKTTTTALTTALCQAAGVQAQSAGNIGPAALSALMDCLDGERFLPQCWVLELSSFQLELAAGLSTQAAAVLNISDDHLDRHGDIEHYAAIKARILEGSMLQVLNREDPLVMKMARSQQALVTIGYDRPSREEDFGVLADVQQGDWLVRGEQRLLPVAALALSGRHNLLNAQAALALALSVCGDMQALLSGLCDFSGLPHRLKAIARRADGALFYDDSKGTNIGATQAALAGLERKVVLIAGGEGKGQDFDLLRQSVARYAAAVVLIGAAADSLALSLHGLAVPLYRASNMEEAVAAADRLAEGNVPVLLSPACASMDMFRDYVHRGESFRDAVLRLPGVTPL